MSNPSIAPNPLAAPHVRMSQGLTGLSNAPAVTTEPPIQNEQVQTRSTLVLSNIRACTNSRSEKAEP